MVELATDGDGRFRMAFGKPGTPIIYIYDVTSP